MNNLADHAAGVLLNPTGKCAFFGALTVLFAALGRAVRGVTTGGAVAGALVCSALLGAAGLAGFAALLTVFLLTWIATRVGYTRKLGLGTAEARAGRNALQVLANLGASAGCAVLYSTLWPDRRLLIGMAASLAEAAADTVSSEIGQAVGGTPRLITTWTEVESGTDGAITLAGSAAGIAAATVVALSFILIGSFSWRWFPVCALTGIVGMVFDSLLGATLERGQIMGNNAVNFASTIIAAALGFLLS